MTFFRHTVLFTLLTANGVFAQALDNKVLSGKYYARHLMLSTDGNGAITDARTFFGAVTFDGKGAYTYQGSQLVGSAAAIPASGAGTYAVKPTGFVTISNPQRAGATINAGAGEGAIVGSSTETGNGIYDLFVAVPAPAGAVTNTSLSGVYWAVTLEFPGATLANMRNSTFKVNATGTGAFGDLSVNGRAANLGDRPVTQTVASATYSVTGDGSGTATFPLASSVTALAQVVSGTRTIYVSSDNSIFIGGSTTAGGHDMLIATKALADAASKATWSNLYFGAGLKFDSLRPASYAGAANASGAGKLIWSRRTRQLEGVIDVTAANNYQLNADGSGTVETNRVSLGLNAASFIGNGVSLTDSGNYEIFFGIKAPSLTGTGVFVNPQGVVNAAGFSPFGNPISPGEFITIFGSGLANSTASTSTLPFPTTLGGVQVLINNVAAPVYVVSPNQLNVLVPYSTTGAAASIVVNNNGKSSTPVDIPLAKTSPGIFTIPSGGTGPGAILHANYTLVSASAPAKRGETVLLYMTGLGAVTPTVRDGAAAPASPLSLVSSSLNVYIGGQPAAVLFKGLAPFFAGLYQLNITIPTLSPTGLAVPLAIDTGDAFHDQVDIAIVP
jgi:uncharacterized protein (TIGR03437 family)